MAAHLRDEFEIAGESSVEHRVVPDGLGRSEDCRNHPKAVKKSISQFRRRLAHEPLPNKERMGNIPVS